jgi:ribosomal protein S18 acetylase RimI-like enzyme
VRRTAHPAEPRAARNELGGPTRTRSGREARICKAPAVGACRATPPVPSDVFLLSPAFCGGRRGAILLKDGGLSAPAQQLAAGTLSLGDAFSFVSGLYFRGKLAYARHFAAGRTPGIAVITPTRGLQPPDLVVDGALLREFVGVDLGSGDPRYLVPLVRDLRELADRLPTGARAVLLGSVATAKYLEPMADVLGDRLYFPSDFIGRGDMSRGALLLQHVDANRELDYVPFATGVARRGRRAPGVAKPRLTKRRATDPRDALADDIEPLAQLWLDGWRDAHADILPVELARLRTLDSFRERLVAGLADTRVIGPRAAPVGFTMLKGDELYQVYVSKAARGTGVAATLVADAERRLAARGVATAWLACAIGNERAARFYEKQGWRRIGTVVNVAETSQGGFSLDVWRYEKALRG